MLKELTEKIKWVWFNRTFQNEWHRRHDNIPFFKGNIIREYMSQQYFGRLIISPRPKEASLQRVGTIESSYYLPLISDISLFFTLQVFVESGMFLCFAKVIDETVSAFEAFFFLLLEFLIDPFEILKVEVTETLPVKLFLGTEYINIIFFDYKFIIVTWDHVHHCPELLLQGSASVFLIETNVVSHKSEKIDDVLNS